MKQILKTLAIFAVAALSLAGCKKELNDGPAVPEELIEVSFTAGMPQTKTAVSGESIVWEASDATAEKNLEFFEVIDGSISQARYNNNGGTLTDGIATFKINLLSKTGNNFQYSAFYPYSAYKDYSDKVINFELKAEQNPGAASFDKSADLLIAKPFGKDTKQIVAAASVQTMPNLQFRRLNALAKMTIKNLAVAEGETISSVKFEAKGVNLAGKASIDITEDAADANWSEQTNYVVANYNKAAVSGNFDVWFSCIPAELATGTEYTITVITSLKTYTKNGTIGAKALVFSEGDVMQFGANFNGVEGVAPAVEIPFEFTTSDSVGSAQLKAIPGVTASGLGSDYSAATSKLKFDSTDDNVIIRTNSAVGSVNLTGAYNVTNTNSYLEVLGSIDGEAFTQIQKFNCASSGTFDLTTSNDIDPNYRFIKINYFKDNGNVGLGYIKLSAPDTTPKIVANDISDVNAAGESAGIADYTVFNFEDDVIVSEFTACVTSAEIDENCIVYVVSPNFTGSKRDGTIVISSASHPEVTKTINVSQNADKFSVNPTSIVLGSEEMDIVSFEVTSTYDFNISNPNEEKIDISKSGPVEGKYTVEVMSLQNNESGEVDVIGNIVITRITEEATPKTLSVAVSQKAKVAEGVATYTLSFPAESQTGVPNYTTTWTATNGDKTWTITNANNNNNKDWDYIRIGAKSSTTTATISSPQFSEAIKTVTLTVKTFIRGSVTENSLIVASDSKFVNIVETIAGSAITAAGDVVYTVPSPASKLYYKISITCNNTTKSNGVVDISKVVYSTE